MEQVLVLTNEKIMPLVTTGFTPLSGGYDNPTVQTILTEHFYIDRPKAEFNPKLKQIIPYLLVRHGLWFMLLQRTKLQGDARIHGKHSLGVGGHINPETPRLGYANILEASLYRELNEEVTLSTDTEAPELIGTLYDDSNSIGLDHIGLVYVMKTNSEVFEVREKDLMTARWADLADLQAVRHNMETWSQILFDRYVLNCLQPHILSAEAANQTNASPPSKGA